MHQRVSKRLMLALIEYFEGRSIGEVFHAPTDVILTDEDVFVPDLLVVRKPEDVSSRGIEGPPVLVVEILSPPTCTQDCGVKAERYAQLGVEHYWIVDPDARRVECRRLEGKRFARRVEGEGDAVLEHPDLDGFVLDVGALWR
jgi:Uma2 family endonuclease